MRTWILALLACVSLSSVSAAEPLVFTGHSVMFSKALGADPLDPANQDLIVPGVALIRGSSAGLFNAAVEQAYASATSPIGTRWAFKNNNGGQEPSADDWATLTFNDWQTSLGGGGNLATNILDGGGVVHLVDQDIYFELRFTAWGVGSGAGGTFTYIRSEITPTADFDRDSDVDGQDFLTWQRGYGKTNPLQRDGDANFDGVVDAGDLAVWQGSYGDPLMAHSAAVPEPSVWLLAGLAGLISGVCRPSLGR